MQSKTERCDQELQSVSILSSGWWLWPHQPQPLQRDSSVEEMMGATGDSLLENLHQRHVPVRQRRGQPTLLLHVTGETLIRTELIKVHSMSWLQPKHREMDDSTSSPCGCRRGWERQLWAGDCCSWLCVLGRCCGSSCRRCWPRAFLRALSSCTRLQVVCPGAQPCCTTVTTGLLWCPALKGRVGRC